VEQAAGVWGEKSHTVYKRACITVGAPYGCMRHDVERKVREKGSIA
jgi:hypothetical protein